MTRRNFDWMQGVGLGATVFAMSALVITDGLQWTSVPAYAAGEMIGVTGEMTEEMRGIRGKRVVMQPGKRSKNARKQTIKVIGNVGRTSEMPRTMHGMLPGT